MVLRSPTRSVTDISRHFPTFPDISRQGSRHFPTFPDISRRVRGCRKMSVTLLTTDINFNIFKIFFKFDILHQDKILSSPHNQSRQTPSYALANAVLRRQSRHTPPTALVVGNPTNAVKLHQKRRHTQPTALTAYDSSGCGGIFMTKKV